MHSPPPTYCVLNYSHPNDFKWQKTQFGPLWAFRKLFWPSSLRVSQYSFFSSHIIKAFEPSLSMISSSPRMQKSLLLVGGSTSSIYTVLQTQYITQTGNKHTKTCTKRSKGPIPSVLMPFLQQGCNPTHHMQDLINLQIEIRKPEVIWSLLPAQMSNLHCESPLSSGDILSSSLQDCQLPPGCLQPFQKVNIDLSVS